MEKNTFIPIFLLFITILLLTSCESTVCGNGILEEGETATTCCLDAGCFGEQSCENNVCIDPICGECQYLQESQCLDYECCDNNQCNPEDECNNNYCTELDCEINQYIQNHQCVDFECLNDIECSSSESCINNECIGIQCGSCEYADEHTCKPYACCRDVDCDDNKKITTDTCVNPETQSASCEYDQKYECLEDTDCDDNDPSTQEKCTMLRKCKYDEIKWCSDGDDYCPETCPYERDRDCDRRIVDCNDFSCMADESDDCWWAEYTNRVSLEFMGIQHTTSTHYEIRPSGTGLCTFSPQTESIDQQFTGEMVQTMLDDGMTMEEITEQEIEMNAMGDSMEGKQGWCNFEPENLEEVLRRWDSGQFSGGVSCTLGEDSSCEYRGDWAEAQECHGDYFYS
jgi:hypothetical protein